MSIDCSQCIVGMLGIASIPKRLICPQSIVSSKLKILKDEFSSSSIEAKKREEERKEKEIL